MWDINIQTDHVIENRRLEIVVVEKDNKMTLLTDIAVTGDTRVEEKEQQKVDKYMYQDLAWELKRLRKVETRVIWIVVQYTQGPGDWRRTWEKQEQQ